MITAMLIFSFSSYYFSPILVLLNFCEVFFFLHNKLFRIKCLVVFSITSSQKVLIINKSLLEENLFERSSEVIVEDGINDRVQGRVAVPEPEGEGKPPRLYAAGALLVDLTYWADG